MSYLFLFSFLFLLSMQCFHAAGAQAQVVEAATFTAEYHLPGLSGSVPVEFKAVIENLQKVKSDPHYADVPSLRRLILHGPNGTGKNTILTKISELTGSKLEMVNASSIVTSFQGSGAKSIQDAFAKVAGYLQNPKATVFLVVDEVDAIASIDTTDKQKDTQNALYEFCMLAEGYLDQRRLVLAITTNNLDKLPARLVDRFGLVIKVRVPTEVGSKKILQDYYSRYDKPVCSRTELAALMGTMNGFDKDRVNVQELQKKVKTVEQRLFLVDEALGAFDTVTIDATAKKNIQELIVALLKDLDDLDKYAVLQEFDNQVQSTKVKFQEVIANYKTFVKNYCAAVEAYIRTQQPCFTPEQLSMIVTVTKGMSIRLLKDFVNGIKIAQRYCGVKTLTEKVIIQELGKIKKKFDQENRDANKKKEEESEKQKDKEDKEAARVERAERAKERIRQEKLQRGEMLSKKLSLADLLRRVHSESYRVLPQWLGPRQYPHFAEIAVAKSINAQNAYSKLMTDSVAFIQENQN